MKKSNNFISIIALGNFNPSILKPSFLSEKCGFKTESTGKGQITPVVSQINYGNVSFLMNLEKFQIMEKKPGDFGKTEIVGLMNKYFDVLQHTPVHTMGLNLNVNIESGPNTPIENLNNKSYLLEILNAKELSYTSCIKYSKERTLDLSWELKIEEIPKRSIVILMEENAFAINYNVELRKIDSDRDKMYFINKNFDKISKEFQQFLKKIYSS